MPDYLKLWEGKRGADAYIKCVGIRGAAEKKHGNKIGIYDDLIVLLIGDVTTEWKASTDPGQYYVKHPTDRHGCAQLTEGIWMYKVGLHRGKWPAFVQAEPFTINRLDQNGNIEFSDRRLRNPFTQRRPRNGRGPVQCRLPGDLVR